MRNNEKGITLISLIITAIIMIILATVTITTSNIIETERIQSLTSNMLLIQAKVRIINERVSFNGDTSIYVGRKLKDEVNKSSISNGVLTLAELESEYFYVYDRETLDSIGLEGIKLSNNEVYIVNYQECDIICPTGVKNENGQMVYRLSEII